MKISIFSAFYPYRGGIAQFSASLYRSLQKKHEVKAYTFKRQYPSFLFPGKTQFVTEKDNADKIESIRILDFLNPFSYFKSGRLINKDNPSLYISNYWMTFFGPAMGIIARKIKKETKQISILHNVIPHEKRFFDKAFTRFFLNKTDGFIVMSDAVLKDLISIKPQAKYIRIDHPVYDHFGKKIDQEAALERLNISKNKKTVLFFGIIRDYKGLDLLIEAMNDVDDNYQLIIAGEVYGSFDKYDSLIQASKNKDNIHLFNHYISDDEVPLYFSAADVCVLPYRSATQSGITAVSNHFTLPIIATDVGGLKETILHNETGLIIDQPDSKKIGEAINNYFNHDLKEKFSQNILNENKKKSWEHFTDKLVDFSKTL